ncbi:MAG: DUF2207 domain-containing protein, partial [Synergistota bacterium]|nr:DUF2207 domain-containing protein [Synergistota bacterium]
MERVMPGRKLRYSALALVLCLLFAGAAVAGERILSFHSSVEVADDGVLAVREEITFNVEGKQIRHGIYRDFPTKYTDPEGRPVEVTFDVKTVLLDGAPVPWSRSSQSNGVR